MYQKFTAVGNLGNEPEMRYTPSGLAVATFNLAINERFTTAEGEKRESTLWIRVTAWREKAENCAKYLHKGSKVLVEGKLKPANAYINKAGEAAASLEITADQVVFMDSKPNGENGESAPSASGKAAQKPTMPNIDDIPF